jgi:tRNA(fMet)-specific endonuclease VapC
MGLIIDTSILIAWERRHQQIETSSASRLQQPVALSVITAAELLHGVHRADTPARRHRRTAFVEQILSRFPLVAFDLEIARMYAELWAYLDRQGNRLSVHDLIIGATALTRGDAVLTLNRRDFDKIPGLVVESVE